MLTPIEPRSIPERAKERLRILFIAKHAKWAGGLHPEDGNHALYHVETREVLESLGLNLALADNYEDLFERPDADFVFPLLNRGGFLNSEMMLPLLCTRLGLPYLGASPILRGLADDKHLSKLCAAARGIPTAPWAIYRRGAPVEQDTLPGRRADGDQAQRLLGELGRPGRARLGGRRGGGREHPLPRAMTRSSSRSSTAATSRCR